MSLGPEPVTDQARAEEWAEQWAQQQAEESAGLSQKKADDETMATQLHQLLNAKGYTLSLSTILWCRKSLGWTYRGSAYGQLTRDENKVKRVDWAKQHIDNDFTFYYQTKAPYKGACLGRHYQKRTCWSMHIWRITKKELYIEILEEALLPFIHNTYPDRHKLMQDNDLKHTSLYAHTWMEENGIVWWKTPHDLPDLKIIWHELKEFIQREVKPKVKEEFIEGIAAFWRTVDVSKWNKYINARLYQKWLSKMPVRLGIRLHIHVHTWLVC